MVKMRPDFLSFGRSGNRVNADVVTDATAGDAAGDRQTIHATARHGHHADGLLAGHSQPRDDGYAERDLSPSSRGRHAPHHIVDGVLHGTTEKGIW